MPNRQLIFILLAFACASYGCDSATGAGDKEVAVDLRRLDRLEGFIDLYWDDSKGRLYRKYFNGTTEYEQYDYDTGSGYLYRIQFTAGGTTTTVWQLTTMDEYARIRQATIGSASASCTYDSNNMLSQIAATGVQRYDYSFDVNTGNLNSRGNFLKSKTESFGYDTNNLDRLAAVNVC